MSHLLETATTILLRILVAAIVCCGSGAASVARAAQGGADRPQPTERCPVAGDERVTSELELIRQKHVMPAMAGAIVTADGIIASGVVGVRKRGTDVAVTLGDKWHLGSNTKAMTATLIGRLVERGTLKWDTTMAEVFPEFASEFHSQMKGVTVVQLLSHRAGLPENLDLSRFAGEDAPAERLRAVKEYLAQPPQDAPGSKYRYSNLGYIVVGAVVEKLTGTSWEQAIQKEVFGPLGMASVGFGGTGTPPQLDQPWGHRDNGRPVTGNGPAVDNPPVMGPAGRVHGTLEDWAKFVADQLRAGQGTASLLKPDTYKTLHTPPFGGDYALGWGVAERGWGGGTVLNHCGSNTMNFSNLWVAPKRGFAVLVCVNQGGDAAFKATDVAAGALIRVFLREDLGHNQAKPEIRNSKSENRNKHE